MNNYAITTSNLTRKFGKITAVDNLNMNIEKGEIFGFLGPNGAGKSTTIRMLCGILEPSGGEGYVGGFNIKNESEKVKGVIGYMSQHFGLYSDLTVKENITFYSNIYISNRKEANKRIEKVIEELEFKDYKNSIAQTLSGGWKQRLALACAIVHKPKILFLDEPTAGIDPVSRRTLWDILYGLAREGITLFVTTHYMEEAERCNKIGFIWKGKLVAYGTPEDIKKNMYTEEILTIKAEPQYKAFEILKENTQILDANFYGDEIHLVVNNANSAKKDIENLLISNGIKLEKIDRIYPSIEDVFVSLSKK